MSNKPDTCGGNDERRDFLHRKTAHDFKNIFSTLIANTELLRENCGDRENGVRLGRMLEACENGINLVEKIRRNSSRPADRKQAAGTRWAGRILLIEQDAPLAALWRRILEKAGYEIASYQTAREGFAGFLEDSPGFSLVLTARNLPDNSGRELIDEIRQIRPEIPCILLDERGESRGRDNRQSAEWFLRLGKPLTGNRLLAAVADLSGKR